MLGEQRGLTLDMARINTLHPTRIVLTQRQQHKQDIPTHYPAKAPQSPHDIIRPARRPTPPIKGGARTVSKVIRKNERETRQVLKPNRHIAIQREPRARPTDPWAPVQPENNKRVNPWLQASLCAGTGRPHASQKRVQAQRQRISVAAALRA